MFILAAESVRNIFLMRIKIPLQLIELEDDNFHLAVSARFKDNSKGLWIIDTGASRTVFDKNLTKLYLPGNEKDMLHTAGIDEKPVETEIVLLKPFMLEKHNVKSFRAALLDLTAINKVYDKAVNLKICGLLGGDFFMYYRAVINYRKKYMILYC